MKSQLKSKKWLKSPFDVNTQNEVKKLMKNPTLLEDAFYKDLEFGTGGIRGIMGVGSNRVNKYTFGKVTQGLSDYLKQFFLNDDKISVVIGYDCRNNSKILAKVVADVLSANNIKVFLFSDLRATPVVSYAVKKLGCNCGIVLTASHNPPEYNGYKIYWKDGGQIIYPHDSQIAFNINNLDYDDINFNANEKLIDIIDNEIDIKFCRESIINGKIGNGERNKIKVVFTPIHGTSIITIPGVFRDSGYNNFEIVEEQSIPDGNFPTVISPNPEETEALSMALNKANKIDADIVIGTDPDSDRLGIAVRNENNELELLNGNQIMIVLTNFVLEKENFRNLNNPFVATTIVSTPMLKKIAEYYNVDCKHTLTGFKWIANLIENSPDSKFICGGEESYGFMKGDFVRDKDAITSSLLACEIVAEAKSNKKSFFSILVDLYVKFGLFHDKLVSIEKKGIRGAEQIKNLIDGFRNQPPNLLDGSEIIIIEDYLTSKRSDVRLKQLTKIDLPKSNVLVLVSSDGTRVAIRPSGTEPKIKFYFSVNMKLTKRENYRITKTILENKIKRILTEFDI